MLRSNVRRGACSAVAAAGAIALGLGVAAPASADVDLETGATTVDLLSITDFHGALLAAPNIAQQISSSTNEDTLVSSVGDSIGGSTFDSAVLQDAPTIDVLNEAGVQVSAVGNHEFDQGFDDLVTRVQPRADFPYLAANVGGQEDLAPYTVLTTENGVRVAYIGTVTTQTPDIVAASGVEGLTFDDPVAVTNELAAEIQDNDEADVVVALIHEGAAVVREGLSDDVDVVFSGHSHQTFPNPAFAWNAPENVTSRTAAGAPIVQSGSSGALLGRVQLSVAENGDVTVLDARNLSVTAMSAANASLEPGTPVAGPFDPEVVTTVQETFAVTNPIGDEIVGTLDEPFLAPSNTGQPSPSTPQHRGAESPLSNLIAEIAYETANVEGLGADFGIINPGGIRADLIPNADGEVTFRQAFGVTSFSNTIGTLDLSGTQVVEMLEQQFVGQGSRPVLALGLSPQLSFLYDPTAPIGSKVIEATITDADGVAAPVDPAATYTVASNVFLLEGQDGFTVFDEGVNPQATTTIDWEATSDFLSLEENAGLEPTYVQQSIGVTPVTDLDQVFAPGDEITVDLSSLSFTNTEPKPSTVTAVVVGSDLPVQPDARGNGLLQPDADLVQPAADPGTVLAEAAVDNANVLDSNETGQATVTVTVPEDTVDGLFTIGYISSGEGLDPQALAALTVTVAADAQPPVVSPEPTNPTPTAPAPTDPPVDGGDDQAGPGEGTLPETGAELAGPLVIVAMLVLLAGLGLVLRRRAV